MEKSIEEGIIGHSVSLQRAYQDLLMVKKDREQLDKEKVFTSKKHKAILALLSEQATQIQELCEELCATSKNI